MNGLESRAILSGFFDISHTLSPESVQWFLQTEGNAPFRFECQIKNAHFTIPSQWICDDHRSGHYRE